MTLKIYYDDPFLTKLTAKVTKITENGIILDRTISYPEGGGQEGDIGVIKILDNNEIIEYIDTQKLPGRTIYLDDFPTIQVENDILHIFKNSEDVSKFKVGMSVEISIDYKRRAVLSAYHSATHLMLMAVENVYSGYESNVYGCHITANKARLDFRTNEKFTQEFIKDAQEYCNDLIKKALPITIYQHSKEKEALYWEHNKVVYPCGGTHLTNSSQISEIKLKRKNLGKSGQRISVEIGEVSEEFLAMYHIKGL